jgi:hypothetical protein
MVMGDIVGARGHVWVVSKVRDDDNFLELIRSRGGGSVGMLEGITIRPRRLRLRIVARHLHQPCRHGQLSRQPRDGDIR